MAYVNVAEWKTDQVCEWLKGLDNSILPYVHSFMNHSVNGQQLLSLRPEDLEHLGVLKLGHQEIILEAVEFLRNFHYELDRENLQLLALRLSCQAHSLHNELSRQTDSKPVTTQTLSDVASVVMAVKPLVRWLDRPPFSGQLEYNDKKAELMKLSLEMATCAQRDRFAEKPIEEIRTTCGQLAKLADYIIQDIVDPMILQPASLDLATLKKKSGDDLGFYILPSFHGAHQIAEIKFGSAAHQCGKMEEGDEIVQVNYQTVVGWERKNLLELFRESPAEILLTLKRRPRHTKVYGQIYIKPYRLPSNKKTSYATRWQHNLPSPRPELLTIPDFTMPLPRHIPKNPSPEPASILDTVNMLDTMATDSSDSDSEAEPPLPIRLYSTKPRSLVQRRATITGASPTTKHGIDIEQFWKELKQEHCTTFQLRDKAASCAHGLDSVPSNIRPQTCLGIEPVKRRKKTDGQLDGRKVQFQEKPPIDTEQRESSAVQPDDGAKRVTRDARVVTAGSCENGGEKSVANKDTSREHSRSADNVNDSNNFSDTTVPLDECNNFISDVRSINSKSSPVSKEIITGVRCVKERGKLDKSYSTPAYDLSDLEDKEDRKLALFDGGPFCKLDLPFHCSSNGTPPAGVLTKTDAHPSFTESADDHRRSRDSQREPAAKRSGNVARKVNDIEKQLAQIESAAESDSRKNSVARADASPRASVEQRNQSNIERSVSDASDKCDSGSAEAACSRKSSPCNCREDNHSELSCSGSSVEGDAMSRRYPEGQVSLALDGALIQHARMKSSTTAETTGPPLSRAATSSSFAVEDDLTSVAHGVSRIQIGMKPQAKCTSDLATVQSCRYIELPKVESVRKYESKHHATPPEPPPRYYPKQTTDVKTNNAPRIPEDSDKPQVPERPNVRRELKKVDSISPWHHARSNSDCQDRKDSLLDVCTFSYADNSFDFIDESRAMIGLNDQKFTQSDASLYSESSDRQLREDRYAYEKYEPYTERFACLGQTAIDGYRSEYSPRHVECPDGVMSSKQMMALQLRPKLSEKDRSFEKSVVNRAMMVARSIGLHGSLSKSNSSPRSNRKRNILLAKRRNVSVREIGAGDLEGWLTYRSRGAGGAWARAWFVLKCSSLYRFKTQDGAKADCLIALAGFTVSQAAEVKSRKYAFKVYHTGTAFYFAADTEDCLSLWLDAINKATLGADGYNQNAGLYSETDESDGERNRMRGTLESRQSLDKSFGSLKKIARKDMVFKDHEIVGASLDRKYLKFLGAKNQNMPVPTAQFRSYRRVLPTSTPNKKEDSNSNSPDLQMTIAGSTFYGLSTSQSATDMSSPSSSQDMGDYRRATDRSVGGRGRRADDLQGFLTLEAFMLSQQEEDQQRPSSANRSMSPRITPLTNDHVHIQHRNFNDNACSNEQVRQLSDASPSGDDIGSVYGRINNENNGAAVYGHSRHANTHLSRQPAGDLVAGRSEGKSDCASDRSSCGKCKTSAHEKRTWDAQQRRAQQEQLANSQQSRNGDAMYWRNAMNPSRQDFQGYSRAYEQHNCYPQSSNHESYVTHDYLPSRDVGNLMEDLRPVPKRLIRNDGYSGSSSDLTSHASSETLHRAKKDVLVSRKGSFNLTSRHEYSASDKYWLDSLRRGDKKAAANCDKNRLKNVAQYQPPPIPTSPFELEGMRAAFEMHLDKGDQVQKTSRLKNLFGTKQQKPCTLDLPKDSQKTILGSPRLHRALFRDKCSNQSQHRLSTRSDSQSPGDSGISQSHSSFSGNSPSQTLSQSVSSVSSASDWSPDTSTPSNVSKYGSGYSSGQKIYPDLSNISRNLLAPPTLPYIPPPTSPPPDYPDLEYPPVFEPGAYSFSDTSLLRNRGKSSQNAAQ
ncbi:PREDICTED: uncharacterized protein LOC106741360 isoform X2 [Dinoponera quadriceps]|uniref:Uncharacterized protein LOC106741360 isoform X2 n=1 Tax=Dinoponera quadriceps TaxID=609295 RepID=A0A6P3WRQ0_DINQU|nr:PREDICTED: uncharacterized protein LOC106741360 isoform X2 [Dinoponera quadriceps]